MFIDNSDNLRQVNFHGGSVPLPQRGRRAPTIRNVNVFPGGYS
jgi:hypothetical protein